MDCNVRAQGRAAGVTEGPTAECLHMCRAAVLFMQNKKHAGIVSKCGPDTTLYSTATHRNLQLPPMSSVPHILWADDEIDLLRSHILFLESKGYQVTRVTNGADALAAVERAPFDVVLLDEQMPGMGGLDTLAAIKRSRPQVPVVMVTKSEEEHLMEEALGDQISDYLTKPVNPSQILLTCKRLLERARLRSEKVSHDYLRRFGQISTALMSPLTHAEWVELYREIVHYDVALEGDEDARQILLAQYREANRVFGRFIGDHYRDWIRHPRQAARSQRPVLSHEVIPQWVLPQLQRRRCVLFFVIDCMRYDQWLEFEKLLYPLFTIEKEFHYAILPTATPYARNAIFSGLLPRDIARLHARAWDAGEDDEHSKNRHEAAFLTDLLRRKRLQQVRLRYKRLVGKADGRAFASEVTDYLQADLSAIVVNFVDILAHSRADYDIIKELAPDERAYRALTRTWFEHSWLYQAFQSLANRDCTIVITTDHGAIRSLHPTKVRGDRRTSTALRYKSGRSLKVNQKHALVIRHPHAWGLPSDRMTTEYIIAREDYYFLYPTNYHHYLNLYNDSMQHGGVSMEEMILPVVTLRPRR